MMAKNKQRQQQRQQQTQIPFGNDKQMDDVPAGNLQNCCVCVGDGAINWKAI
jgi:hypothetical protein